MPINPHSHVPIYEQIVEHIHGSVAAGLYRPGESLPSIRALALELLVNPNTVQRAYQELERQGLVYMRKGLGVFVATDGASVAKARAEAAVRDRFTQGIDLARSASLSEETLRSLFDHTLRDAQARPSGKGQSTVKGQGLESSDDARNSS